MLKCVELQFRWIPIEGLQLSKHNALKQVLTIFSSRKQLSKSEEKKLCRATASNAPTKLPF